MMRFKTDENLPVEVSLRLSKEGHDAISALDQQLGGQSDDVLMDVCQSEKRILITLDVDFADIRIYPPTIYSGIIVLRLARQEKTIIMEVLDRVIPLLTHEKIEGGLWIVDESNVRIRF